jgi:hypothetical protein
MSLLQEMEKFGLADCAFNRELSKANYTHLEIMAEVAWQVGDSLENKPRAESRWLVADLAQRIIGAGIITPESEDIDEIISGWLDENYRGKE